MRKFSILLLSVMAMTTVISGCATILAPSTHPLAISSEPDGAEVYLNGERVGVTPVRLDLKADKSYTIEYRKEGYETVTRVVNTKVGAGWVIADILFGLVPVIVDAATGKWNQLDQDAVDAQLERQRQ